MLSKLSTFAAMAFVTGFPLCTMNDPTFGNPHSTPTTAPETPLRIIADPVPPMADTPDRPVPSPTIIGTKKVQPKPTTDCSLWMLGIVPIGC